MHSKAIHNALTQGRTVQKGGSTHPNHGRREPRRVPGQTFLRAPRLFNIICKQQLIYTIVL